MSTILTAILALKCLEDVCNASVMAGRGYCGKHGGPARLKRENREEDERVAKEKREAAITERRREEERKARHRQSQAIRHGWGSNGAPPGLGLSRFVKPKPASTSHS